MSLLRDHMWRDMERAGLAQRTKEQYRMAIRLLAKFHRKAPDLLTPDDLRAWEDDLIRQGLSPSSRVVYLAGARFFYRRTLFRPEMVSFLARPRVPRKLPVVLGVAEVHRILVALRDPRYRVFFSLIYDTGLRVSEARQLKAGDIDSERGVIHVRQGKGGKERQVKLGNRLLEMLREYWREVRLKAPHQVPLTKESFLFATKAGAPISVDCARNALKLAARDAGIFKRVGPHTLRHSYATAQLDAGTDLRVIQAQLGHADISSTQIYVQVSARLIQEAPSPLDALAIF